MTRIARISRIRGCGIFRDFLWPDDLLDFGRYNLIYGWNGTGKTTISRILRALELRQKPPIGQIQLVIGTEEVPGERFPQISVPIRVFNRDFVEESVFRKGGSELPPIFVFGKENVEKQKEVEKLKQQLEDAQSRLTQANAKKEEAEKQFDRFCIDRAKIIKDMLRSRGQNRFNNYDKSDFRRDAQKMAEAGNGAVYRLSDTERDRLLKQHQAVPKPKVQELIYALPDFGAIVSRVSNLLTTTVVSATIEALKNDPSLADWTRQGLELHRERKAERCLFCEQSLPKDRLAALEKHFSDHYEHIMRRLDELIKELQRLSEETVKLQLPNKAEVYDDLGPDFQAAETGVREALKATRGFLEAAIHRLEEKKRRPFEHVELELETPLVDPDAVQKLNAVIRKHNQACDDFQIRVNEARERLARDMIAAELEEFVRLQDAIQRATDNAQKAEEEVQRLKAEIAQLEQEIVEHRQPAEELNEDLRKYLGHDELRLEIKETGYTIMRGSVPAQALSEGEMTAIALLYFLKSLQDKEFDLERGIVVLDDPVSSLDANALYLAFGFIRERTQNAGQLIILTHNFAFFRQVRNWFHHLKGQNKKVPSQRPARFYMLDCVHGHDGRCAAIRWLDPLLEQYDSEYHYLFARVYRAANETGGANLEKNYELPNMARRLLEAFLAFRQPQISGDLWQKVQAVQFHNAKKLRILRFLHTHSHSDAVGEPQHDPSGLAEGAAVLRDLLELIKSQDPEHFSAMEQLVAPPSDSGNGESEVMQ